MSLEKIKHYFSKNLEDAIVLSILSGALLINYFLFSKLAFLDFFYLLIVLAGYTLGKRFAVLGAFFAILTVWIFILASDQKYFSVDGSYEVHLNLTVWGGFLILAAWLIGSLSEKLKKELRESNALREALSQEREMLKISNEQIHDHNRKLEEVVSERTQELKLKNQELKEFAGIASHDLKEPLRKIILFGEQLNKRIPEGDDQAQEYLSRMQKAADRMQRFIDDLLKLSQVTGNEGEFKPVNLSEIVHEVLDDLEARLEKSQGSVNVGLLPTLESDALQMRQLFQNFISNALKFSQPNVPPIIFINARQSSKGYWEISVSDNGMGIDHKHLSRIFKPFERLHGRSDYEGSGMGLAICKKIIDRHKGRISVFSEREKGTTFQITLPEFQTTQEPAPY